FLPDVELKQARVIGHVVVDFGRGQAVALQLKFEIPADRGGHRRILPMVRAGSLGTVPAPVARRRSERMMRTFPARSNSLTFFLAPPDSRSVTHPSGIVADCPANSSRQCFTISKNFVI